MLRVHFVRKPKWKEEYQRQKVGNLPKAEQLAWLQEYADSQSHFDYTPTTYYGDHDPFDVPFSACIQCGSDQLRLWTPREGKPSWRVICSCGNRGSSSEYPRKAVFRWNKSSKSRGINIGDTPLFQLDGLTRSTATERLYRIQNDLSLRVEIANLRSEVFSDVSPGYVAKLVAYTDWTQYLLDLLRRQPRQGSKKATSSPEIEEV